MPDQLTLECPIRGTLKARARSADGLLPSEEKLRIEAIRHLLDQGYPREHVKVEAVVKKFGHGGRNSMRADLAVLDVPVATLSGGVDELLEHSLVLAEVKREHGAADQSKHTQVKPLLDFSKRDDCIALYWDDVEQRVYWQEWVKGKRQDREGPLALLPRYGDKVNVQPLTFQDLQPTDSLLGVFRRIEDILHAAAVDPEQRYGVILQLLLAKLYDEHAHQSRTTDRLDIQDFAALSTAPSLALSQFNTVLASAASFYGKYLPRPVDPKLSITGTTLIDILQVLGPVKIIASKHSVVQAFYMYFAKHLYRWDLAQYFTPTTVTTFIVEVFNLRFGEHVKDPACGSADFLTAAFRIGRTFDSNYADNVWGSDNSTNAVQVAVLNMLLNGDGKTNIAEEDSLANVTKYIDRFEVMVCNPPFGSRIIEKRASVLSQYDLGHAWVTDSTGALTMTKDLLDSQQLGILFLECCVKQTKPGGRIGIILPNGYLGNRSQRFRVLRDWLLRSCRLAAICSFPRFTFKTSGADVSASVVYLERRRVPLRDPSRDSGYRFAVELIQSVGWSVGDKRAEPIYRRDPSDGTYIIGPDGAPELQSDFSAVLADLRDSPAVNDFPWLSPTSKPASLTSPTGWAVDIAAVLGEPTHSLDPKRWSRKVTELRQDIARSPHFRLGDVVDFMREQHSSAGVKQAISRGSVYRLVELETMGIGEYSDVEHRGWELPARAKHHAEPGDIYVGAIWGSVSKWFLAGANAKNIVVTNGCHRLRVKPGHESFLVDLVAGLCSEAYAVQMRAFARGSDGLAEVHPDDAADVLLPITDDQSRRELEPFVTQLRAGADTVRAKVQELLAAGALAIPQPVKRPSHSTLV